jgi:hypothetical protein
MKRVLVIALVAMFSTAMFAQTKMETKPATTTTTHKKKSHSTEAKPAAQPTGKKAETTAPAKKTEPAGAPVKK